VREVSVKIIMDVVGDVDINRSNNGDHDHDHH